jgi:formylglycine-generating enzyme required for sulfatase activity
MISTCLRFPCPALLTTLALLASWQPSQIDENKLLIKNAFTKKTSDVDFYVGVTKFSMRRISPGSFNLGAAKDDDLASKFEKPMRMIRITKPYYIGKYEITQKQYNVIMAKKLARFKGDDLPVEGVLFSDAIEYCEKLSAASGVVVTLPTHAQWEYACRGDSDHRFIDGKSLEDLDRNAWFESNSGGKTHEVGKKKQNRWGLHDMLGNVWEPSLDILDDRENIPEIDPVGRIPLTFSRMHGGGWQYPEKYCRVSTSIPTDDVFGGMGIRIVVQSDDN